MGKRSRSILGRRALLWGLLGACLLLIAAAILVVSVLDEEALRSRFEAAAADSVGVELTIAGPVSLSVWPTPGISAAEVVLDRDDARLGRVDAIRLDVALVPLLFGKLQIRHVSIDGAEIEISRDSVGQVPMEGVRLPSADFSAISVSYLDQASGTRSGWSECGGRLSDVHLAEADQRGPLAGLRAEGTLNCAAIDAQDFHFTEVELELSTQDGLLRLEPIVVVLFGGTGNGRIAGDFTGDAPHWSLHLELESFALEEFLQALEPEARAEGRMDLFAELSASGDGLQALERSLSGTVLLSGKQLTVHGADLDKRLEDYEATQSFGLIDAGALFFAGPVGLVVTRGHEFAQLLRRDEGSTDFRQIHSEWAVQEGVAEAVDVAAASAKNRLAARGRINYAERSFDDLAIILLDRQGCALMEQSVRGSFEDPQIEEPGAIVTILGPLIDLVESGFAQLAGEDCEIVYDGTIAHP